MKIEIPDEEADYITVQNLKEWRDELPNVQGMFSLDPEEDREQIAILVDAFDKVIAWYS
jgi:hypothetical protein